MTTSVVETLRHYCALGSQQTVLGIERAVPVLHCGPGCSSKLWWGLGMSNGCQGTGYCGGSSIPCTNATEKEVILGGEERLRETIEGALQVMDGDLFVVLTGCVADIIGDDTGRVVREFQQRGAPVVCAETGGFKGTGYEGHEIVVKAIIDQFVGDTGAPVTPGLVNVWSAVPYQDPFWSGNLSAMGELLRGLGLEANILFGPGSGGVEAWKRIPSAQFNLVVSPWVGLGVAKLLEKKYGTPFLHCPVLPIGPTETSKFLRNVGRFAGVEEARIERYVAEQEAEFYYYLERAADLFLENRNFLPNQIVTILDSYYSLGVCRFLSQDLGLLPRLHYITDETPEEHRGSVTSALTVGLPSPIPADVRFECDSGVINRELRGMGELTLHLVLASDWDKDIAEELNAYHLALSSPLMECLILNRSHVGYRGGLRLMEDIYGSVIAGKKGHGGCC